MQENLASFTAALPKDEDEFVNFLIYSLCMFVELQEDDFARAEAQEKHLCHGNLIQECHDNLFATTQHRDGRWKPHTD